MQIGAGSKSDPAPTFTASDFFDFSIYVDAEKEDIERWYVERLLLLKRTAFKKPKSYFHHLAAASDAEAGEFARNLWSSVNLPNLIENILPTRSRSGVVIHKDADHIANELWLRRF